MIPIKDFECICKLNMQSSANLNREFAHPITIKLTFICTVSRWDLNDYQFKCAIVFFILFRFHSFERKLCLKNYLLMLTVMYLYAKSCENSYVIVWFFEVHYIMQVSQGQSSLKVNMASCVFNEPWMDSSEFIFCHLLHS